MTAAPLPCFSSRPECLITLTEAAVARSPEITALDERLELVARQLNRQYERRWTAILPALGDLINLNPMGLLETLFGGGGFRDVDVKLAELELRVSDLVRRRAEVTGQLQQQLLDLVLDIEQGERQIALLRSQIATHQQRLAVIEIGYRLGEGSTEQIMELWQQRETLEAQLTEETINREQSIRRLSELTGYEAI